MFSLLYTFWPQPAASLLIMALLGLLVVPHALEGRHRGPVTLAVPVLWLLLGTVEGSPLAQTLEWSIYSVIGVLYAIGARELILRTLGWNGDRETGAPAARGPEYHGG